jgi:DNA-binding SARP family transcriptional activator
VTTLRIRLLGSLDLERDGHVLERFPSRKARDLFAFLAIQRDGPHAREQLAGTFWGDSTGDRARHALNTTLWRINRVLGSTHSGTGKQAGYLRVTPQYIAFNAAGDVWLDVAEFESRCVMAEHAATQSEQAALYQQAISFYRGDLLPDNYEDWCLVERERLQAMYLRALARLMTHHASNNEHEQAIDCGRRILGCDPLQEEVHRDLIRLYVEVGQPAAALRQFRACEELLQQELAIKPTPETRALLGRVLGAAPEPIASPRVVTSTVLDGPPADPPCVAAQLRELSALCETLRAGLAQATNLVAQLTDQLNYGPTTVPVDRRLRKVVG